MNENASRTNLGDKNGMVKGWDKEQHEEDSALLAKEDIRWERGEGWERDEM